MSATNYKNHKHQGLELKAERVIYMIQCTVKYKAWVIMTVVSAVKINKLKGFQRCKQEVSFFSFTLESVEVKYSV